MASAGPSNRAAATPQAIAPAVAVGERVDPHDPVGPADLAFTPDAALDALVARLERSPLRLFAHVHDRVFPETYRGARRTPASVLALRRGNDLDTAVLLADLLRHGGVPARLELARLALTPEQAMSLTGTTTAVAAASVLRGAGIDATAVMVGADVRAVTALHWQVRAWVAADNAPGFRQPLWAHLSPLLKSVSVPPSSAAPMPPAPTRAILQGAEAPLSAFLRAITPRPASRRAIVPWVSPLLPLAPAAEKLEVLATVRDAPVAERVRLTLRLQDAAATWSRDWRDLAAGPLAPPSLQA